MLPPIGPMQGWRSEIRLSRDHYVRLDSNDCPVDPTMVGSRVQIAADLWTVTVAVAGGIAAAHRHCWARHQTIIDPAHVEAADRLRGQRIQARGGVDEEEVEVRSQAPMTPSSE